MIKIYHIHIRKTAGTALLQVIKSKFDQSRICPIRSEWELKQKVKREGWIDYLQQFQLISGHFYTLASLLPHEHYTYLTFLRNPLHRVISVFKQMQNDKRDVFHKKITGLSLVEALESNLFNQELQNGQLRFLVSNAGHSLESLPSQKAIEVGLKFLGSIDFFGIQELMGVSALLFNKQFCTNLPSRIPRVNTRITEGGLQVADLSSEEIELIIMHNKLDMILYEKALDIFDKNCVNVLNNSLTLANPP